MDTSGISLICFIFSSTFCGPIPPTPPGQTSHPIMTAISIRVFISVMPSNIGCFGHVHLTFFLDSSLRHDTASSNVALDVLDNITLEFVYSLIAMQLSPKKIT